MNTSQIINILKRILYVIETLLIFSAIWYIFSGINKINYLVFGAVSVLILVIFCNLALLIPSNHKNTKVFLLNVNYFKLIIYFFWLLGQIIISSINVMGHVFAGKNTLDPLIVWFKSDYDNPNANSLLANSITLTPGTVTVDISDQGIYSVHCITPNMADGLLSGNMQRKVAWVYGESIEFEAIKPSSMRNTKTSTYLKPKTYRFKGKVKSL